MSPQVSVIERIPVRNASPSKGDDISQFSLSQLEERLMLLMSLVSKVKQLPHVVVKQVPLMMPSGEIVSVPGAWTLRTRSNSNGSDSSNADLGSEPSFDDEEYSSTSSRTISDRFVVRNEFGHARLQPLLEFLDAQSFDDNENSLDSMPINVRALQVGGHCVLPPDVFDECLDKGWGTKHPFAGRFHPITGTTIPTTTLLYHAPRNEYEVECLWRIILHSYEWAKSTSC